jgi:hypothetical protein
MGKAGKAFERHEEEPEMTTQSERIKAAHRGLRQAEPASRSRLAALDTFRLRYERLDDFNVIVEGKYLLNLALSYWRSLADKTCHGYLVSALNAKIVSEKPAAGRDSIAEGGRTASTTTADPPAIAESAAGPVSSSLLPETKWP